MAGIGDFDFDENEAEQARYTARAQEEGIKILNLVYSHSPLIRTPLQIAMRQVTFCEQVEEHISLGKYPAISKALIYCLARESL